MIPFALFFLYTTLFAVFIYFCKWFALELISKSALLILFFIKVTAAFSYIYINKNHITAGDIFNYYNDSLIVFEYLKNGEIATYLQLTFGINNVEVSENIAKAVHDMGFWYDTSSYMQVRLNALINLFTFGQSIYTNAVFFAFISFTTSVAFVKLFKTFLAYSSKLLSLTIFLFPSVLFWTSGMHKETTSAFLIIFILFGFLSLLKFKQVKYLILVLVASILLFFLRFFITALLLVPLLAYFAYVVHNKYKPIVYFGVSYFITAITLYFLPLLFSKPNIIDLINHKKELYLALKPGNTDIDLGDYSLSYFGYFIKTPQSLMNTTTRPFFTEANTVFLKLASIESLVITLLLIISLFYLRKLKESKREVIYVFYSFSFSYLILTGLIVPNIGAILRYRSLALFLLIPPSLFLISENSFFKKK